MYEFEEAICCLFEAGIFGCSHIVMNMGRLLRRKENDTARVLDQRCLDHQVCEYPRVCEILAGFF